MVYDLKTITGGFTSFVLMYLTVVFLSITLGG